LGYQKIGSPSRNPFFPNSYSSKVKSRAIAFVENIIGAALGCREDEIGKIGLKLNRFLKIVF
jgi:hypothetical protein